MQTIIKLRLLAEQWADEAARDDLKFVGDAPFIGLRLSQEEKNKLREGIVQYARTAASRTVAALQLHGHLKP